MEPEPVTFLISAFSWRNIAFDLKLAAFWVLLSATALYFPVISASPFRVAIALPMILFVPGYALIAALFPSNREIDGIERVALSFGLSIAVAPLIGLALNYTPFGIRLDPIVVSLSAFTLAMIVIGQYRRFVLPVSDRFSVPAAALAGSARAGLFSGESRLDRALSVILVSAIVVAVAATAYVIAVPKEGERFTEFYILGEKGKAADYPTALFTGINSGVTVGIGNHEYGDTRYVVETWLFNTSFDPATNVSTVDRVYLVDRFEAALAHNTTYEAPVRFTAMDTGYNQLKFLLFRDAAPPEDFVGMERVNASYRDLHLWVTIRSREF